MSNLIWLKNKKINEKVTAANQIECNLIAYCVEVVVIFIIIIILVSVVTVTWHNYNILVYQKWYVGIRNTVRINESINSQSMIPLGYQ